jgi:hypothetical protein
LEALESETVKSKSVVPGPSPSAWERSAI